MGSYSYSEEISRNQVTFCDFDIEQIKIILAKTFESYKPRVKEEIFDSFCEDFYGLTKEIHASNERIWRMVITDMLFSYDEKGYLEAAAEDNSIKRKQFAIIANVVTGKLQAGH